MKKKLCYKYLSIYTNKGVASVDVALSSARPDVDDTDIVLYVGTSWSDLHVISARINSTSGFVYTVDLSGPYLYRVGTYVCENLNTPCNGEVLKVIAQHVLGIPSVELLPYSSYGDDDLLADLENIVDKVGSVQLDKDKRCKAMELVTQIGSSLLKKK